MVLLDKQPTTPKSITPVILPEKEVSNSYVTKPEQHHTAPPPVLQPIKDSVTEEKEV